MKRLIILSLSIAIFFCGCISTPTNNALPSDFTPIDLSYEHVAELTEFKCNCSYHDKSITIEGDQAKKLFNLIWNSATNPDHNTSISHHDYVHLVFYNGEEDYWSPNSTCYGTYSIYENDSLLFSLSPLHSSSFDYKLEPSIFNEVVKLISNS